MLTLEKTDIIFKPCDYCHALVQIEKEEIHGFLHSTYRVVCESSSCLEKAYIEMGYTKDEYFHQVFNL